MGGVGRRVENRFQKKKPRIRGKVKKESELTIVI